MTTAGSSKASGALHRRGEVGHPDEAQTPGPALQRPDRRRDFRRGELSPPDTDQDTPK